MTSQKIIEHFYFLRVSAVLIACALLAFSTVNSFVFDAEVRGPEFDSIEREYNDRENEKSFDRVHNEGSTDSRDVERSREYERDNCA